jgi:predicted dehydrogenase
MTGVLMDTIGVGIIGASPGPASWAANAHVPALRALPEFELRAVGTSRPESATTAARAYGVAGYHDCRPLIERPDIDLVVVAVKVPQHHALVAAALAAGKAVYCEWPLAATIGQAEDLAARAEAAGARTMVGLQGRYAPAVRRARELVAAGALGTVQSTTLTGSGTAWGPVTDRGHAYLYDEDSGASTLTAAAMHALDALTFVLGPLGDLTATMTAAQRDVRLAEDGTPVTVTAPDQVAVTGRLPGDAVLSAFYRGGVSAGDNLRWEISGSQGELLITSLTPGNGNLQAVELELRARTGDGPLARVLPEPGRPGHEAADTAAGETTPADGGDEVARAVGALPAPAANVARLYRAYAADLREGTVTVPDFGYALGQHRLVEAIREASRSGQRQPGRLAATPGRGGPR